MGCGIGIALALVVVLFAKTVGFDKDRSFYSVVLIVVASYYVLFAAIAGFEGPVLIEIIVALAFVIAAAVGFKKTLWLVMGGLTAHGIFDSMHHLIIANPGVPEWWPPFCLSFDVTAAVCLGFLLRTRRVSNVLP